MTPGKWVLAALWLLLMLSALVFITVEVWKVVTS